MDAEPYRFYPPPQPYRWIRSCCLVILALASIGAWWLWRTPGTRLLSVQSGSMAPLIHKGDAVLVEPVSANVVRVGDIISYRSAEDAAVVITHRVQAVNLRRGVVVTKGDHNVTPDQPVGDSQIVGRVRLRIVGIGRAIDALHSPAGLVTVVYGPAS